MPTDFHNRLLIPSESRGDPEEVIWLPFKVSRRDPSIRQLSDSGMKGKWDPQWRVELCETGVAELRPPKRLFPCPPPAVTLTESQSKLN